MDLNEYIKHKTNNLKSDDWVLHTPSRRNGLKIDAVYVRASFKDNAVTLTCSIGLDIATLLNFKFEDRVNVFCHKLHPYNVMIKKSTDGSGYKLAHTKNSNILSFALVWRGVKLVTDNVSHPVNFDMHENFTITLDLSNLRGN
jgi:hypothetical protein